MKKGIRLVASVLAGAIFMSHLGVSSYATEPITYLSEEDVDKKNQDGTEKEPEKIQNDVLEMAKKIPVQTDELPGWPKAPKIYSEAAVVMDMENGSILYGKSMDQKYYPASITKIMTALLALENSEMTDMVTFSEESMECMHAGYAHIAMLCGEKITMKDALYAMMLASANEVAYAIGETVGGTYENFVNMMNERAKELGCENTHFVNTNGIHDEEHYVSARDMALITREAFSHEELLEIMQTLQYTIEPTELQPEARTFQQKHKMLLQGDHFDERCFGGKTGYTEYSYNTLVSALEAEGRKIVIVLLASRKDTYENTKALADYAFENFQKLPMNKEIEGISNIPEDASVTIPKSLSLQDLKYEAKKDGRLHYYYDDHLVGSTVATVKKEYVISSLDNKDGKKEEAFSKKAKWSKKLVIQISISVAAVVLILILLVSICEYRKKKKLRERRKMQQKRRLAEKRQSRNQIMEKEEVSDEDWF